MKMLFNETHTTVILNGGRLRLLPKGTVIDGHKRDRVSVDDNVLALPDVKRFADKKKITIASVEEAASRESTEEIVAAKKVSAHQSGDGLSAVLPPKSAAKPAPEKTPPVITTKSVLDEKKADDARLTNAQVKTAEAIADKKELKSDVITTDKKEFKSDKKSEKKKDFKSDKKSEKKKGGNYSN